MALQLTNRKAVTCRPMATTKHGGKRPGAGRPKGSKGPTTENPRDRPIAVRLDATTDDAFRAKCRKAGMTPSDRLRLLIEADLLHDRLR